MQGWSDGVVGFGLVVSPSPPPEERAGERRTFLTELHASTHLLAHVHWTITLDISLVLVLDLHR